MYLPTRRRFERQPDPVGKFVLSDSGEREIQARQVDRRVLGFGPVDDDGARQISRQPSKAETSTRSEQQARQSRRQALRSSQKLPQQLREKAKEKAVAHRPVAWLRAQAALPAVTASRWGSLPWLCLASRPWAVSSA